MKIRGKSYTFKTTYIPGYFPSLSGEIFIAVGIFWIIHSRGFYLCFVVKILDSSMFYQPKPLQWPLNG